MAIMDTKIVQLRHVFSPHVIAPDGCTFDRCVREARFVRPPAETQET
jgi:hypothetical protein